MPLWTATILPLALAALMVWVLRYPMLAQAVLQRPVELETAFFNLWAWLIAVGLLPAMGFTLPGARQRGERRTLAAIALLTVVAALVAPLEGLRLLMPEQRDGLAPAYRLWGQASVLALLPATAYALLAIVDRWWSASRAGRGPQRLSKTGIAGIHGGFALAVVAITLCTILTTSATVWVRPGADRPSVHDGIGVRALELRQSKVRDGRGVVVERREALELEVYVGAARVSTGAAELFTYHERSMGRHARVLLHRGAVVDTQVIYHGLVEAGPAGLPVTVRRIPLATAVWVGVSSLALAMGLSIVSRFVEPEDAGRRARGVPT